MPKRLHIIYIPGLGDEHKPRSQLWAVRQWARYGVDAELFRMYWGDKKTWHPKFNRLILHIDRLVSKDKSIGIVAASAGASAAINAFAARPDVIVGLVLIAGKVNRPNAIHSIHYTKNPAMPASVEQAVKSLEQLDPAKRRKILSRYGLFDGYVKRADSCIPGAHNQVSPTLGHFLTIAFQLTLGAPGFILFLKQRASKA